MKVVKEGKESFVWKDGDVYDGDFTNEEPSLFLASKESNQANGSTSSQMVESTKVS